MTETQSHPFLPYGRQTIDADDIAAVVEVLESAALTTGPKIPAFEKALALQVDAPFATVCSNGTTALHLAAAALGLGEGDAVIVPTVTFLATANAARYVGAEVIFADVDADTGLMKAEHLEQALTVKGRGRVKAVFPVHMMGHLVDLPTLKPVADQRGLSIVEDACHALGGQYGDDHRVGACHHSDMACFSFHPVKTIAMGEGGAVTTRNPKFHEKMQRLRSHGIVREANGFQHLDLALDAQGRPNPWYYEMPEIGWNYRATDFQCALGLSQLKKLSQFVDRRQQLVDRYRELLPELAPIIQPVTTANSQHPGWHLMVVLIDFDRLWMDRSAVMRALLEKGIGSQVHYLPVHHQPYYCQRYGRQDLPGADRYYARCLSLPLYPAMNDGDVERVVAALKDIVDRG